MNKVQLAKVKLKYHRTDQVLKCDLCKEAADFIIKKDGDVECADCGHKKGNINTNK